jgi:hypothetical protein
MWKHVFFVIDVILKFESAKRKTTKSRWKLTHVKLSKNMFLGQKNWKTNKLQLIWTYENMVKF